MIKPLYFNRLVGPRPWHGLCPMDCDHARAWPARFARPVCSNPAGRCSSARGVLFRTVERVRTRVECPDERPNPGFDLCFTRQCLRHYPGCGRILQRPRLGLDDGQPDAGCRLYQPPAAAPARWLLCLLLGRRNHPLPISGSRSGFGGSRHGAAVRGAAPRRIQPEKQLPHLLSGGGAPLV